jgi:hypothetical protein
MPRDGRDGLNGRDGRQGEPGDPGRNVTAEEARQGIADELAKIVTVVSNKAAVEDNGSLVFHVKLERLAPLINERLAEAAAALPRPKDGQDGKAVEIDAVKALVRRAVLEITGLWPRPKDGNIGQQGDQGPRGPMPSHRWDGAKLQFERPDGTWGDAVDLRGPAGINAGSGGSISRGYSKRTIGEAATIVSFSKNRLTAPDISVTTPPKPADFDDFLVVVSDPANTGCSIVANSGQTIDGQSSFSIDIVPCALWFSYDKANTNWFKIGVTT